MKKIYTILAENKPGGLDRICGITRRYGWNINSLVAAETQNTNISRITMALECNKFCELPEKAISKLDFVVSMEVCEQKSYSFHQCLIARGPIEELKPFSDTAARIEDKNGIRTAWFLGINNSITELEFELCRHAGIKTVRSGPMALEL